LIRRKPAVDLSECLRLIGKRRHRDALYNFEEILDKLIEAKKSPRGSQVAKELKKLVTAIEDSFKRSYYESDSNRTSSVSRLSARSAGKARTKYAN